MKYIKKMIDNYNIINKICNLVEDDFKNKEKLEESIFIFIKEGGRRFFNTFNLALNNKYLFPLKNNIYSIKIKSYNNKNKRDFIKINSKDFKILEKIYNRNVKNVYIFDDIIDSGETFRYLVDFFRDNKNIFGYFLIDKINSNNEKKVDLKKYYKSLFEIETIDFIFGFGMDLFNQKKFRDLDDIYIFKE